MYFSDSFIVICVLAISSYIISVTHGAMSLEPKEVYKDEQFRRSKVKPPVSKEADTSIVAFEDESWARKYKNALEYYATDGYTKENKVDEDENTQRKREKANHQNTMKTAVKKSTNDMYRKFRNIAKDEHNRRMNYKRNYYSNEDNLKDDSYEARKKAKYVLSQTTSNEKKSRGYSKDKVKKVYSNMNNNNAKKYKGNFNSNYDNYNKKSKVQDYEDDYSARKKTKNLLSKPTTVVFEIPYTNKPSYSVYNDGNYNKDEGNNGHVKIYNGNRKVNNEYGYKTNSRAMNSYAFYADKPKYRAPSHIDVLGNDDNSKSYNNVDDYNKDKTYELKEDEVDNKIKYQVRKKPIHVISKTMTKTLNEKSRKSYFNKPQYYAPSDTIKDVLGNIDPIKRYNVVNNYIKEIKKEKDVDNKQREKQISVKSDMTRHKATKQQLMKTIKYEFGNDEKDKRTYDYLVQDALNEEEDEDHIKDDHSNTNQIIQDESSNEGRNKDKRQNEEPIEYKLLTKENHVTNERPNENRNEDFMKDERSNEDQIKDERRDEDIIKDQSSNEDHIKDERLIEDNFQEKHGNLDDNNKQYGIEDNMKDNKDRVKEEYGINGHNIDKQGNKDHTEDEHRNEKNIKSELGNNNEQDTFDNLKKEFGSKVHITDKNGNDDISKDRQSYKFIEYNLKGGLGNEDYDKDGLDNGYYNKDNKVKDNKDEYINHKIVGKYPSKTKGQIFEEKSTSQVKSGKYFRYTTTPNSEVDKEIQIHDSPEATDSVQILNTSFVTKPNLEYNSTVSTASYTNQVTRSTNVEQGRTMSMEPTQPPINPEQNTPINLRQDNRMTTEAIVRTDNFKGNIPSHKYFERRNILSEVERLKKQFFHTLPTFDFKRRFNNRATVKSRDIERSIKTNNPFKRKPMKFRPSKPIYLEPETLELQNSTPSLL